MIHTLQARSHAFHFAFYNDYNKTKKNNLKQVIYLQFLEQQCTAPKLRQFFVAAE
jgi:hypothetical protein